MKRIALLVFCAGILVLSLLLLKAPKQITNQNDLNKLEPNQKVVLNGRVSDERILSGEKSIFVINEIDVVCDCLDNLLDKKVKIEGVVSEFENTKQIKVLKIEKE